MRTYFRNIIFFVIAVHLGLIVWIIIIEVTNPIPLKPKQQKLAVKTISTNKQSEKILQQTTSKEQKEQPPKIETKKEEETKTVKKDLVKTQKKDPVVKNSPQNKVIKKDTGKKTFPPSADKKTSKAQESIANIRKNLDKGSFSNKKEVELADLGGLSSLNIDSSEVIAIGEAGYYEALVSCLKGSLTLPELGEVKVRLTVDCNGKVLNVETLQSKSAWNRQYLETRLPAVAMPSFEMYYKGITQKTFTITLTNGN